MSNGPIVIAKNFICLLICCMFGALVRASPDPLPRLYSAVNGELFPWSVYITPEDTILRYFKEPLEVGGIKLNLQLCAEYHFFKTQSIRDAQNKPLLPGQHFLVRECLSDIYLASWLSACSKLNCGESMPVDCEQYLSLLAPAKLEIEGIYNFTQLELWPTLVGKYSNKTTFVLGLSIPVLNIQRSLSGELIGGSLFGGVCDPQTGESSLTQFFSEFSNTRDFIRRAVFDPKGIEFDTRKSLFFIPRVTVDTVAVIRSDLVPVSSLFGVRVAVPAMGSSDAWSIDSFVPEEFHSTQITLFANWFMRAMDNLFPYVLVGFLHQLPHIGRVPLQQIKDQNSCIFVPQQFTQCRVEPFVRRDSVVPEFADQRFYARTGTRNGMAFGTGVQYFPSGQETVALLFDYRIVHKGATTTVAIQPDPMFNVLPAYRTKITTQLMRFSITLVGDNYFSLFNLQMNVSNLSTQMRLAFCFGTAL